MEKNPEKEKESEGMVKKEALNKLWRLNIDVLITNVHKQAKMNLIRETPQEEKP